MFLRILIIVCVLAVVVTAFEMQSRAPNAPVSDSAEDTVPRYDPRSCGIPAENVVHFRLISGIELTMPWPGPVPRFAPPGSYTQPEGPVPVGCPENPMVVQAVAVPFFYWTIAQREIGVERLSNAIEMIQLGSTTDGTEGASAGALRAHELAREAYNNCVGVKDGVEACHFCVEDPSRPGYCAQRDQLALRAGVSIRIPSEDAVNQWAIISCKDVSQNGRQRCSSYNVLRQGLYLSYRLNAGQLGLDDLVAVDAMIRQQALQFAR